MEPIRYLKEDQFDLLRDEEVIALDDNGVTWRYVSGRYRGEIAITSKETYYASHEEFFALRLNNQIALETPYGPWVMKDGNHAGKRVVDQDLDMTIYHAAGTTPHLSSVGWVYPDESLAEKVIDLIRQGADAAYECDDWYSVLINMLDEHSGESVDIIRILLNNGADPSGWGRHGFTAIYNAVKHPNEEEAISIIKLFIARGLGDWNSPDDDDVTPMDLAIKLERPRIFKLLKSIDAQGNGDGDENVTTCIHNIDFSKYGFDMELDIDLEDDDGFTLLSRAAWDGDIDKVRYYLDQGADPNVGSNTPIKNSCKNLYLEISMLLTNRGAKLSDDLITIACQYPYDDSTLLPMVQWLISQGVDPGGGLSLAAKKGCVETVKFLSDYSLEEEGDDAMKEAISVGKLRKYQCYRDIILYLEEKGIKIPASDFMERSYLRSIFPDDERWVEPVTETDRRTYNDGSYIISTCNMMARYRGAWHFTFN